MALSGLQIFKLLPKTNCKECGKPTCMAFAMALAGKKCSLSDCPHALANPEGAIMPALPVPLDGAFRASGATAIASPALGADNERYLGAARRPT